MVESTKLTVFEALFILAIDDEKGNLVESEVNNLEPAVAGAVLAEQLMHGRIEIDEGHIIVTDPNLTENPILDHTLFEMFETMPMRKVKYWINTLIFEKLCTEIGQSLVEKRVMVRKKKRMILVVPHGIYSSGQVSAKYDLKNRLRDIILTNETPQKPELIQLALLYHCGLLTLIFTKDERKSAARKIENLITTNGIEAMISKGVQQVIRVATRSIN